METLEEKIKRFLSVDSGSGDGDGDGSGYGSGYGYGYGSGDGSGDGSGYGYGSGSSDGSGLTSLNGNKVYIIDSIATIIYNIRGNVAQGAIVQKDMTLKPCYVAKEGNCFAHGETAHQAALDAHKKYLQNMPEEDRIQAFMDAHPNLDEKYPASDLFEWHNTLTGSCRMGRESFCMERGIDVANDSFTVRKFIKLTKDSYGGDIIKKLLKNY